MVLRVKKKASKDAGEGFGGKAIVEVSNGSNRRKMKLYSLYRQPEQPRFTQQYPGF